MAEGWVWDLSTAKVLNSCNLGSKDQLQHGSRMIPAISLKWMMLTTKRASGERGNTFNMLIGAVTVLNLSMMPATVSYHPGNKEPRHRTGTIPKSILLCRSVQQGQAAWEEITGK